MKKFWLRFFGKGELPQTAAIDHTLLGLLGLAVFVLYALTAQPVVGWGDAAGFAAACYYADIAHAPGYPLYSLLCHPFSYLPLDNPAPAFRAALFSAACAAAAVVVLIKILYVLTKDAYTAAGGGLLFAVSRTFWSQATIPEVYTLNVLLFLVVFLQLLHWREKPTVARLALIVFLSGLALTNHWPLFLLAAAGFLPLLWRQRGWLLRQLLKPRCLLLCAAALLLGLLPYGYLYWRANYPAAFVRLPFAPHDIATLWQIVSRDIIIPAIDKPEGSTVADSIAFMIFLARRVLIDEIGIAGGGLILLGFFYQWRQVGAAAASALLLVFLSATVVLLAFVHFLYDERNAQIFSPYPLLPYAVACTWAAIAVRQLAAAWRAPILLAVCAAAVFMNMPINDRSEDTLAADIADTYLAALPPGAFFPLPPLYSLLIYRQYTTGQRPDVLLLPAPSHYSEDTFTPGKKLYPPNTLTFEEKMIQVNAYAENNPVCYNTYIPFSVPKRSQEYVLFSCLTGDDGAADAVVKPRITDFLYDVLQQYNDTDDWGERVLIGQILRDATRTMLQLSARQALPDAWKPLLETLSLSPPGQLASMEYLVSRPGLTLSARRADLFRQAALTNLPLLPRRQRARLLSALADSFAAVAPRDEQYLAIAARFHREAIALLPAASAPAVRAAYRFYERENMLEPLAALKARYGTAIQEPLDGIVE